MATLTFLGAAQTVTGSRHLITTRAGQRVLIDAGLFQGKKELRQRNWAPWTHGPIDCVVLTHAHIDHTGYLPRLVAQKLVKRAVCTRGTKELAELLLPDSGHIQEEDARNANRHGWTKHEPALPLYTEDEAWTAVRLLEPHPYERPVEVVPGVTVTFRPAGHIVGSAFLDVTLHDGGPERRVVFSGDLGRFDAPLIIDPVPPKPCDVLILETTYGDRQHPAEPSHELLARLINEAISRGGPLLIPAFAVGRTQELLFLWRKLEEEKRVPVVDLFVDSPMANDATDIYLRNREDLDPDVRDLLQHRQAPLSPARLVRVRGGRESAALLERKGFFAVIAASGMATGGRILSHLERHLPSPSTTVLLVGYQAEETRGRRLLEGAQEVKMHGGMVPVRAKIEQLTGFSAHADFAEEERWLSALQTPPQQTYLVHGEPKALVAQTQRLSGKGWQVRAPQPGDVVEL
ncbi:MAG: MBL fold metallo-hydrolase [Deltaproteobacteria bacterium]|nr:MBL fold metallo-hydrolase [Deltaproteobacteria bacterium]